MVSTETAAKGSMLGGVVSPEGALEPSHLNTDTVGDASLPVRTIQERANSHQSPLAHDGGRDINDDVISDATNNDDGDGRIRNFSGFSSEGGDGGGSLRGAGMVSFNPLILITQGGVLLCCVPGSVIELIKCFD